MRSQSLAFLVGFASWMSVGIVVAHPAHETHAEMAWDAASQSFEVALKVRGIDLESALAKGDPNSKRIDIVESTDADERIAGYLRTHFIVEPPGTAKAKFAFVGKEVDEKTAWLYFEFVLPDRVGPSKCSVTNRMLFGTLDGQINKIDLRIGDSRQILSFNEKNPTVAIAAPDQVSQRTPWSPPDSLDSLPSIKSLPDLFTMADGTRVQSLTDWEARRAEIKEMIQYYEYGRLPPRPDSIGVVAPQRKASHDGLGIHERMVLSIGTEQKLQLHVALHLPARKGRRRHPVVMANVHRITELPCIKMFLENGFAFVQYQREDLDPDKTAAIGPAQAAYPDHDWATIGVWAWGAMRVVDYLETRDDIDLERIAVTGHSRGGKAALLAGSLDERFALVAPNGSGCGGAGCFRGTTATGESLAKITDPERFGYWFHPRLRWFADREDRLPFDQHFVKALVAPRALLCTEARGDLWANPAGTRRTSIAARDVYAFLDARDRIGLCYRDGEHNQLESDWARLLEFAQWQFFDKVPPDTGAFWQAP